MPENSIAYLQLHTEQLHKALQHETLIIPIVKYNFNGEKPSFPKYRDFDGQEIIVEHPLKETKVLCPNINITIIVSRPTYWFLTAWVKHSSCFTGAFKTSGIIKLDSVYKLHGAFPTYVEITDDCGSDGNVTVEFRLVADYMDEKK